MVTKEELSLEATLAWVFARDLKFVLFVETNSYEPLEKAHAKYSLAREKQFEPVAANWAEAWRLLHSKVIEERLEVRGVPFEPRSEIIAAVSRFGSGPPRVISSQFLPELHLEEAPTGAVLLFHGNSQQERLWWRDVDLDRGAVMEHFPSLQLKSRKVARPSKPVKKSSRLNSIIREAVEGVWPDGISITETNSDRDAKIRKWAKDKLGIDNGGGSKEAIGEMAIYRYFRDHHGKT
jgi:hypothetical protein